MSLTGQRRIGAFKPAKAAGLGVDQAEDIAATAFAVLVDEPQRLTRFMSETGIGPDDLRAAAGSRDCLCAVLEHVLADESLLLVLTTQANLKPETVVLALQTLQTPSQGSA